MRNTLRALAVCAGLVAPAEVALAQDGAADIPRIQVLPAARERAQQALEDYPNRPDYQPGVHADLALQASEAAYLDRDLSAARELLEDTYDQIGTATVQQRQARAALQDALAKLAKQSGDLASRVGHARAAYSALQDGDPGKDWARLKLGMSYVQAVLQKRGANWHIVGLRYLKEVRDSDTASEFQKAYAEILLTRLRVALYGRSKKAAAETIEAILDRPGVGLPAQMAGLLAMADLAIAQEDEAAVQAIVERFNREITEHLPEDLDAVEILPVELGEAVSLSGHQQLMARVRNNTQFRQSFNPPAGIGNDGAAVNSDAIQPLGFNNAEALKFISLQSGNYADLSYCIGPDGKIQDMTVLESQGSRSWVDNLVEQVESRVFSQSMQEPPEACRLRYERWSVETTEDVFAGTRIAQPSSNHYLAVTNLLGGDLFDRTLLVAN
ncbi:MAG: hypothetical protein ACFB22_08900 [Rhodothalassiaceae bacterium]